VLQQKQVVLWAAWQLTQTRPRWAAPKAPMLCNKYSSSNNSSTTNVTARLEQELMQRESPWAHLPLL
jgi:hypothetical protein